MGDLLLQLWTFLYESSITQNVHFLLRAVQAAVTVNSTILVLSRESNATLSGTALLQGYGIPFQVVDLSRSSTGIPVLNSSATSGNYGGIITVSARQYENGDDWNKALTMKQWQQIYDYQEAFGVRLVRLNAWPNADFGVSAIGKSSVLETQDTSITNSSDFTTANLIEGVPVSLSSIAHYPAAITNASIAFEIAQFAAGGKQKRSTAAVYNKIGNREQQVWFMSFESDLSTASAFLSHAWIHWMTRGLYLGFRRVYFNTQVDDVFVETELYSTNKAYRIKAADLQSHVTWMQDINSRLPSGSSYKIELGHNGNGNIEAAVDKDYNNDPALCNPQEGIEYSAQPEGGPLEYKKPLGSGKDIWPKKIKEFTWSRDCMMLDPLLVWLTDSTNRDKFFHVSHTFTHEDETNATYADVQKEITWNQKWFKEVGLDTNSGFSPNGIIPPGITGLHNGDALRAWMENGIKYVVGDNSRPVLMDVAQRRNGFWPVISNVADNGYDGVNILGRWGTSIYYNCDLPDCDTKEWTAIAGGKGDFGNLLAYEKEENVGHLLGLRWDPFMFHQANLRVSDTSAITVNGKKGKYSLLMAWTETVIQEMTRLTAWPIITLKHDDIATQIINRMTRDQCVPNLTYQLSDDRKAITGIIVSAANTKCSTPIPVTFPGAVKSASSATKEQVGKDPLTLWVTLGGKAQSYTLSKPVSIR
ncbi:hypothetical protein GQ43DRAFT_495699 [Delitschia confertaspora ATCC 74209]|uniref:Extracellular serine-rich protein n=1 Tax=Delitschia confertaspora ATCC 74209 TaxID=1513339 RepID=A0A9P4MYD6_9PLEO|nr:hypothetical protein GQ43DRAFT_495699 [Delitschia confertaspora ATCC 74209]